MNAKESFRFAAMKCQKESNTKRCLVILAKKFAYLNLADFPDSNRNSFRMITPRCLYGILLLHFNTRATTLIL